MLKRCSTRVGFTFLNMTMHFCLAMHFATVTHAFVYKTGTFSRAALFIFDTMMILRQLFIFSTPAPGQGWLVCPPACSVCCCCLLASSRIFMAKPPVTYSSFFLSSLLPFALFRLPAQPSSKSAFVHHKPILCIATFVQVERVAYCI
jgi:hypothetical protein